MIPGPFSYHRPATLADAVKLLSTLGDEARPFGRRSQPGADDEAPARHPRTSGRFCMALTP